MVIWWIGTCWYEYFLYIFTYHFRVNSRLTRRKNTFIWIRVAWNYQLLLFEFAWCTFRSFHKLLRSRFSFTSSFRVSFWYNPLDEYFISKSHSFHYISCQILCMKYEKWIQQCSWKKTSYDLWIKYFRKGLICPDLYSMSGSTW